MANDKKQQNVNVLPTVRQLLELSDYAERFIVRCDECGARWGTGDGGWFWLEDNWFHDCPRGKAAVEHKPVSG